MKFRGRRDLLGSFRGGMGVPRYFISSYVFFLFFLFYSTNVLSSHTSLP